MSGGVFIYRGVPLIVINPLRIFCCGIGKRSTVSVVAPDGRQAEPGSIGLTAGHETRRKRNWTPDNAFGVSGATADYGQSDALDQIAYRNTAIPQPVSPNSFA
jgi:hypothetical protein